MRAAKDSNRKSQKKPARSSAGRTTIARAFLPYLCASCGSANKRRGLGRKRAKTRGFHPLYERRLAPVGASLLAILGSGGTPLSRIAPRLIWATKIEPLHGEIKTAAPLFFLGGRGYPLGHEYPSRKGFSAVVHDRHYALGLLAKNSFLSAKTGLPEVAQQTGTGYCAQFLFRVR